jgi:hypothetical protein
MMLRRLSFIGLVFFSIAARLFAPALADDKSALKQQPKHFEK